MTTKTHGVGIGTDVQAEDPGLTSIAGLTTAANTMIYTTALDTYAVTALTSAGRALLDDTTAAAQATTLGLGTSDSVTFGQLAVDNIVINANDISTTSGNLTLTPVAGSAVVIDGAASFDAGVVTGITDLTSGKVTSSGATGAAERNAFLGVNTNVNIGSGCSMILRLGTSSNTFTARLLQSANGVGVNALTFKLAEGDTTTETTFMTMTNNNGSPSTTINNGGLIMGAPTGADKGTGTINVATDVYKNNSAYTNPDYVLEYWGTGKIEKFKDNPGAKGYALPTLEEIEKCMRETHRLPRMTDNPMGSFSRQDWLLEKMEEAFVHIIELNKKSTS